MIYKADSTVSDYFSTINVSVDVNRFGQVVRNIISNALKFTPSGGMISISTTEICAKGGQDLTASSNGLGNDIEANVPETSLSSSINRTDQQYIRIDISDTGPGITQVVNSFLQINYPQAQKDSLFREVVQFDDPLSTNANGAGLGLWSESCVFLIFSY